MEGRGAEVETAGKEKTKNTYISVIGMLPVPALHGDGRQGGGGGPSRPVAGKQGVRGSNAPGPLHAAACSMHQVLPDLSLTSLPQAIHRPHGRPIHCVKAAGAWPSHSNSSGNWDAFQRGSQCEQEPSLREAGPCPCLGKK